MPVCSHHAHLLGPPDLPQASLQNRGAGVQLSPIPPCPVSGPSVSLGREGCTPPQVLGGVHYLGVNVEHSFPETCSFHAIPSHNPGRKTFRGSQQEDSSHPRPPHLLNNKSKLQKTELGAGVMPRRQGAIQVSFLKEVVPWRVARGGKDFHFSKCLD